MQEALLLEFAVTLVQFQQQAFCQCRIVSLKTVNFNQKIEISFEALLFPVAPTF